MDKLELSEKKLEELLKELPKIEDHRHPHDIYQNISLQLNKRKRKTWIVPTIASAAAVMLFAILIPNVMNWNETAHDTLNEKSSASEESMQIPEVVEEQADLAEEQEESLRIFSEPSHKEDINIARSIEAESEPYTAVYEADVENQYAFTYIFPDLAIQNSVPITVLIPKEEGKTTFTQYVETMSSLNEAEWNVSEYYPLNADLIYDEKTNVLNIDVPVDHSYSYGSASVLPFRSAISYTAKQLGVEKVTLSTAGTPGILFEHEGIVNELTIEATDGHAYYLYYPNELVEKPYIVPYNESFEQIETALEAMKNNDHYDTHLLQPSIPSDFVIEKVEVSNEELLTIYLADEAVITNSPAMIHTIEAILLTAKDFRFKKVKIENANIAEVGKFKFNEEWAVPVAPNKKTIE